MRWSELAGKRILVLGTGREGRALADALLPVAALVTAVDERDEESAAAWRTAYGDRAPLLGVAEALAAGVDVAIASPGIPPRSVLRQAVAAAGIPETTQTALWLADHAAATTAVTGSKGKSTTTSLIHALLVDHGVDAQLGGNIGIPLLSIPPAARYAVELSSQQASSVDVSPDVVVLTALFPEHLDWHGDEETYYRDKLNLAAHGARRVLAASGDELLRAGIERHLPGVAVEFVGAERLSDAMRAASPLRGRHNEVNLALAIAAVEAGGTALDEAVVVETLNSFLPLAHRLEPLEDPSGLTFVDDSLSTSPYAAIAALQALGRSDVVLLLGGKDRGVDYAPLAAFLAAHPVAGLVGMPESGPRILAALAATGIPAVAVEDMDAAVQEARRLAPPGGVVLLSPAAPSYGRYRDFADRADDFRRAVSDSSDAPSASGGSASSADGAESSAVDYFPGGEP